MTAQIEKFVPPGGSPEQPFSPREASDGNIGRFSLPAEIVAVEYEFDGAVAIPENSYGNPMSPYEVATGVQLPIVGNLGAEKDRNKHHAHFYKHQHKNGSNGQRANRFSRLQEVNSHSHQIYHKTYDGSAFVGDEMDEYKVTVLNCAGYIPDYGVQIAKKPKIVRLGERDKKILSRRGAFSIEKYREDEIGRYLIEYALSQEFPEHKMDWIEEFLSIKDEDRAHDTALNNRRLILASKLTDVALNQALQPVYPIYKQARVKNKLNRDAPLSAYQLVKTKIKNRENDYRELLKIRLLSQFG